MSQEMTISEKDILSKKLAQEIAELEAKKTNLETQIISLNKHKKSFESLDNTRYQMMRNRALKELSAAKEEVVKEKSKWSRLNSELLVSQAELDKKKCELGDIKTGLRRIQLERVEIYQLRRQAEELMRQAKEQWGEVEGFKQSHKAMKDNLLSQLEEVKRERESYMNLIGSLSQREKAVRIRENNCAALEMKYNQELKEEVANVA